jgi:hypothetical protein
MNLLSNAAELSGLSKAEATHGTATCCHSRCECCNGVQQQLSSALEVAAVHGSNALIHLAAAAEVAAAAAKSAGLKQQLSGTLEVTAAHGSGTLVHLAAAAPEMVRAATMSGTKTDIVQAYNFTL